MADFQQNFLSSLAGGLQIGQQIKQQRDTSQINRLAGLAYGADPGQRESFIGQMHQINPTMAAEQEKSMAMTDERRQKGLVNAARILVNTPEQFRAGQYARMVPGLSQYGLSSLPPEYNAETSDLIMQTAQGLVRAADGSGEVQQFTLGPGSKRFDAAGNVIAEVPFAPASGTIVTVADGMGGKMQKVWDPRTRQLSDLPSVGGQAYEDGSPVNVTSGTGPDGTTFRFDPNMPAEDLELAMADVANGGSLTSATLPPRDVTPQQFARGGRLGYTPPEQKDAPSGYSWDANGVSLVPIPGGPADRKANPTAADQAQGEMGMRKELAARLKEDRSVMSMYQNVQSAAAKPSAAGDLSMIFAFMKMLDPGSVVREQEFANAQNAAGVPDRIRNMWNRALEGERLNPNQRADFLNQARQLASSAQNRLTSATREYQGIADQYGYDPSRATGMADFRDVSASAATASSAAPQQTARPMTEADFNALPAGALYIDPDDGRTYRKR